MICPNLFYFLSVPFFHSFSLLIRAGNLANTSGAEQHHHAMSRHATPTATPSPRSEQLRTHEQPRPNGIRAHTDRNTITPPGFRIYDKPNLTASIPMGKSEAAAALGS